MKYIITILVLLGAGYFLTLLGTGYFLVDKPIGTEISLTPIMDLIKDKPNKAEIKSKAISKLPMAGEYTKDNYRVEIIGEVKHIEINGSHGIELFARAWKDGKQIGFGDGTIEIERFRFYNPPILVSDPTGTIEQRFINEKTKEVEIKLLKEDLSKTTKEYLVSIIKSLPASHVTVGSKTIITGKVGNTTSTFNPETSEGGGNVSQDGFMLGKYGPWAAARESTTGVYDYGSAGASIRVDVVNDGGSGNYVLMRSFLSFPTSAIGTDEISSATFVVRTVTEQKASNKIVLGHTTLADPATLATTDWISIDGLTGNITVNSDQQTPAAVGSDTTLTLDATGLGNIEKTGVTQFALVNYEGDALDSAPSAAEQSTYFVAADAGGDTIPRLIVVHEAAAAEPQSIHINITNF